MSDFTRKNQRYTDQTVQKTTNDTNPELVRRQVRNVLHEKQQFGNSCRYYEAAGSKRENPKIRQSTLQERSCRNFKPEMPDIHMYSVRC